MPPETKGIICDGITEPVQKKEREMTDIGTLFITAALNGSMNCSVDHAA